MYVNHNFQPDANVGSFSDFVESGNVDFAAHHAGLTAADLDMRHEVGEDEKLALRTRVLLIGVVAAAPWACAFGIYKMFV